MKSEKGLALHKFVVLIIVLMIITGTIVYTILDSDLFSSPDEVTTVNHNTSSNTTNN